MNGRRSPVVPPTHSLTRRIAPSAQSQQPRGILGLQHRQHPQRDFVEHEDPIEPFPEGDVVVPEACWFQHPEAPKWQKYYKPERQWGDVQVFQIEDLQTQQFGQLLDYRTHFPSATLVRLSAVDISGQLARPDANLTVQWTVDIGCGRALQILTFSQRVQPQIASALPDPTATALTDISFQLPIQACRVSGTIVDDFSGTGKTFNVQVTAMIAPFTVYPDMVAP